jgi:D-aspartate ligase
LIKVMVLSGTASAINYIKSFTGDPEIDLHVTDSDPYCPGLYAPGVTPHVLPRARDTDRYRTALDRLLAEHPVDVLIPTSDYDVEGVIEYLHDGWQPKPLMFRPGYEAGRLLGHKGRMMAHLGGHLPEVTPRTWSSTAPTEELPFPVVVKPTGESGGRGISIVREAKDLPSALKRVRALFADRFVIQEFIPGRTYVATMVYDRGGKLAVGVGMRSHRTFFTWGGGGCAGEMVDEPEMLRLTDKVVQACGGWRGPINFEWRRHAETGAWHVMEANCRLNGYSYLTTMNGVPLPRIVLALLLGQPLPKMSSPAERTRNFTLGFRETLVSEWVHPTVT